MSSLKARRTARRVSKAMPKLSGSYFQLLTPGNPKTIKGMKRGYYTFILHLAPADLSGFQVCPLSTAGCRAACLNTAGRGGIAAGGLLSEAVLRAGERTNAIQLKRIWRTKLYFTERQVFLAMLVADIRKAIAFCDKWGFIAVFRLNGTSDIRWELARFEGRALIGDVFADVQFYDYTKIANRKGIPANYHITFSLAEDNDASAQLALACGHNVAVVFRDKATVARYIEEGFMGADVFVGDESDLRFLDPKGICALYAKGNARRDTSGFVRD